MTYETALSHRRPFWLRWLHAWEDRNRLQSDLPKLNVKMMNGNELYRARSGLRVGVKQELVAPGRITEKAR